MKWWLAFKANPLLYLLIGVGALVVIIALVSITGRLVNSYKESQFAQERANFQRQLAEGQARDKVLAEQIAIKDKQIADSDGRYEEIKKEKDAAQAALAEKRVVYIQSKQPRAPRVPGSGESDTDLLSDAAKFGIKP